ncbi:MAG: hypothetical protein AAB538_00210 [Patescibacteria group bacterium]
MPEVLKIMGAALALTSCIFLLSLVPLRRVALGQIENIHGIPYPQDQSNSHLITEPLAHADIYFPSPVLAQELRLEIKYTPTNLSSLAVGVREDSFWLGYGSRQPLPTRNEEFSMAIVKIPLTDKFQEIDRSLDLMFFAESPDGDAPLWQLHDVQIGTSLPTMPSYQQFRNYAGSILKRERAL